jgi:hypothetical protein
MSLTKDFLRVCQNSPSFFGAEFFIEIVCRKVLLFNTVSKFRANVFKLKTIKKYLRVDRREIHFIKFIIEAYDGLATLTTIDPDLGVVLLSISPGCEDDVEMVLQDLQKDILIEQTNL